MGGAVSAGEDNDELVDKLVQAHYIKRGRTEQVLRAVDRGHFVEDEEQRNTAYKDLAWKHGHLHVSAPCIYSEYRSCIEVLDGLSPEEGMAVLNLGSGTGYLSTLFGLLVGSSGLNHGVELHADVIEYAEERVAALLQPGPYCPLNLFDFAYPVFVNGNLLHLKPPADVYGPYDRLYCGAAVPEEGNIRTFVLSFLKLGGTAVLPYGDQLQKIRRRGPDEYETTNLMSVSFASLVPADEDVEKHSLLLPSVEPQPLQAGCRAQIRARLRAVVQAERPVRHKDLVGAQESGAHSDCGEGEPCQRRLAKRRRRLQRAVMPMLQVAIVSRASHRRRALDSSDSEIEEEHGDQERRLSYDEATFPHFINESLRLGYGTDEATATANQPIQADADDSSSSTEPMQDVVSDTDSHGREDSDEEQSDQAKDSQGEPSNGKNGSEVKKVEVDEEELKDGIDATMPDSDSESEDDGMDGRRRFSGPQMTSAKRRVVADSTDEDIGEAEAARAEARKAERAAKTAELEDLEQRMASAIAALPLPPQLRAYVAFQKAA